MHRRRGVDHGPPHRVRIWRREQLQEGRHEPLRRHHAREGSGSDDLLEVPRLHSSPGYFLRAQVYWAADLGDTGLEYQAVHLR